MAWCFGSKASATPVLTLKTCMSSSLCCLFYLTNKRFLLNNFRQHWYELHIYSWIEIHMPMRNDIDFFPSVCMILSIYCDALCGIFIIKSLQINYLSVAAFEGYVCHTWTLIMLNIFQDKKYVDGLVQERHNSSGLRLVMELRLSCTNPSLFAFCIISQLCTTSIPLCESLGPINPIWLIPWLLMT